ncbi:MAG TPA: M28 family peptidase [Sphingomicrobium sp.]|nr:M28 family peptidase [Sphingomicrobium sp.]
MRRATVLLAIVMLALLGAMAAAPLLTQPPPLRTENADGQFDARRAKARLALILGDQRPHPADTAADDAVRSRLLATMRRIGLDPVVRDQFACNELYKERGVSCARVRNVIAISGPRTGKALLLNAHYDSVPVGPGAGDDGIGVATLLEVGAILANRPPRRPVILLFNEGEELGLIGARAFLADPLSRTVDSLVNLEARGVRGPVNMFETSRPNAAAVALFADAAKHPSANSLSTDVYRLMPNYTDVNSFSERGWLTLNLAPIGNETRYHSPGDDVAALNPATLQHMGDQTLALARALADGTPRQPAGNRIFMDVSGRALVTLPLTLGVLLLAGLLLWFAALVFARGGALRGSLVVLGSLAGSGALSWLALTLIGFIREGMFWRAHPGWTHLATYAGVLLVGALLLASIGREVTIRQLRVMFWLLFLCVGALIGLFAAGGIVFFLLPPLLVLIGVSLSRWWRPAEAVGAAAAILFLYLTWGAMLGLLQELLNGGPVWLFAPLATLLLLPVLIEAKPLIDNVKLSVAGALAGLLVLAGWAVAAAAPAYSADRQQRFVIQHVTDAGSGKSWWSIVNDRAPLPRAFGSGWKRGKLPIGDSARWIETAPADPNSKAPVVQLISELRNGNERRLTLRLLANGNEDIDLVAPEDANISHAGVQAFVRPIDRIEGGKYYIGCSGRSCDGATLELTTRQPKPIGFLVIGSRSGLPPSAEPLLRARPRFARPQYAPNATIAFARIKL